MENKNQDLPEQTEVCCPFHDAGGTRELVCGGDMPSEGGRHTSKCSYHFGAECSCGARVYSEEYFGDEGVDEGRFHDRACPFARHGATAGAVSEYTGPCTCGAASRGDVVGP